MKKYGWILVLGMLLVVTHSVGASWDSRIRQGYQTRQQFFDPQEVRPWLDDTISSATTKADEAGPITEIESIYDFSFMRGILSVGVFARALTYVDAAYTLLATPLVCYQDQTRYFQGGRLAVSHEGSGLVIGSDDVLGARYRERFYHWESEIFYYGLLEISPFENERINLFGYRETLYLTGGKLGAVVLVDESDQVTDVSRQDAISGVYTSISGDWEFENDWFLQAEVAQGNQAIAAFAGMDIPVLSFLSGQIRIRYQDEGFAPLLGLYARDAGKQTVLGIKLPFDFFSERFMLVPRFGLKHTPERNYWIPGLSMESHFFNSIWVRGLIVAEQPQDAWGDYQHYEYTQLQIVWMVLEQVYIDVTWSKTFDGFLDWKEIQNKAGVELRW